MRCRKNHNNVENNMKAELLDLIPSELLNIKGIHEKRFNRRKEALDDKQKEIVKSLEPYVAAHRKAVHQYEDHFDDGTLKYGRDPSKMPFEERDPSEIKIARKLKRAVEDAELVARNKERDLLAELKKFTGIQVI